MSFLSTATDRFANAATHRVAANNQRLVLLVAWLEKIRTAVRAHDAEASMTAFTFELLQLKTGQPGAFQQYGFQTRLQRPQHVPEAMVFSRREDEVLLFNLEYHGAAIATILNAMDRFLVPGTSPEFYNSATIALVHLAFQKKDRCRALYEQGGTTAVARMMQMYRTIDYIQVIGIAALMVLGTHILDGDIKVSSAKKMSLESLILSQIVEAMEYHQGSSRIYTVACSALGTLFGPRSQILVSGGHPENYLYHRVLYALTFGLILHLDDSMAQGVGNALLSNMVGHDVAEDMIAEVERNHGGVTCAAAA